jgi:hypothetical protein
MFEASLDYIGRHNLKQIYEQRKEIALPRNLRVGTLVTNDRNPNY